MFGGLVVLFLLQAAQPDVQTDETQAKRTAEAAERRDVYTDCFLRELSALEKRDVANATGTFSKKRAATALKRCQVANGELAAQIEKELAADAAFADKRLRSIELQNRMAMKELPLLLLIYSRGR